MKTLFTSLVLLLTITATAQQKQFAVTFDFDGSQITKKTGAQLDSFMAIKRTRPAFLYLYGHCDSIGNNPYNDQLSVKRIASIKEYLIAKGFNPHNFIQFIGYGKRKPLNNNSCEYDRQLNRRVEIIVENDETASDIEPEESLTKKITSPATKKGTNIVLKEMNFYGGTHTIMPGSLPILMELIQVMKDNPTIEIGVEGHICCQPDSSDGMDIATRTMDLSVNRAKVICEYLAMNGIDPKRLKYKGFGHSLPVVPFPEKTEDDRTKNRRVEIKILAR